MPDIGSVTAGMRDKDIEVIYRWLVKVLDQRLSKIVSPNLLNTPQDIHGEVALELLRQSKSEGKAIHTILEEGDRWDLAAWVWKVARGVISHDARRLKADGQGRVYNEANSSDPSQSPIHTTFADENDPVDLAALRELLRRLEAALDCLPEEQKIACKLRLEGATYQEIAEKIFKHTGKDILVDTVGNWFRRGELRIIISQSLQVNMG